MTEVVAYLYPWDVLENTRVVEDLREVSADRVALAAYYHGVRAATPRSARRRILQATHSALYVRESGVGSESRIQWRLPTRWSYAGAFEDAAEILVRAGLGVDAWAAITHADDMPSAVEFAVRNAWGDRYEFALCPSHPEVQTFAADIAERLAATGVEGCVLEATSQLAVTHASVHDKTLAELSTSQRTFGLSICFCDCCCAAIRETGVDDEELRAATRRVVDGIAELPDEFAVAVSTVRERGAFALQQRVTRALANHGVRRLGIHATADETAMGPSTPWPSRNASTWIVEDWTADAAGAQRVSALADRLPDGIQLGAYVSSLNRAPWEELGEHWRALVRQGVDELHVYHVGLMPDFRLRDTRRALDRARS